jgi:hypothetical protein
LPIEAMKRHLLLAAAVLAGMVGGVQCGGVSSSENAQTGSGETAPSGDVGDAILAKAYREHAAGLEVGGQGTVTRILTDDTEGGRHQRFIVRLASGQTLLVAHNIDLAPRVADLRAGDTVTFRGEYEWNAEGGTIHWTHHDPAGDHTPGWIRHDGQTYQ